MASVNSRVVAALFLAATLLLAQACTLALAQTPPPPPPPPNSTVPVVRCPDNLVLLSGGIVSLPDVLPILGGLLGLSPGAAVDCLCVALGQITNQIRFLLAQIRIIDLPVGFQCGTPIPPNPIPGNPPPGTFSPRRN